MATPKSEETETPNLITDLEKSFQDCITNLTSQEYFSPNESEETKQTVEHTLQHFLDTARTAEAFFLSQRLCLSIQKPEQVLKEDISELRLELERKEKLVEKHHERLQSWVHLLHRSSAAPPPPPTSSTQAGTTPTPSQQSTAFPPPQQGSQTSQAAGTGGAGGGGYPGPPPQQPGGGGGMHPQGAGQYPGPPLPGGQGGYSMPPPHQPPPSYPQNPLTYLEQNLSNIGMPERR